MSAYRNRRTQLLSPSPAADHYAIVDAVNQLVNLLNEPALRSSLTVPPPLREVRMPAAAPTANSTLTYLGAPFTPNKAATVIAPTTTIQTVAGGINKPQAAVVGTASHGAQFIVRSAPVCVDGIDWLLLQGTVQRAPITGWAAITNSTGLRILAPEAVAAAIQIKRPLANGWKLSQGWGAWPELYKQITYDGVALKGHNGLDFAAPVGTPITSTDAGVVKRVDFEAGGFGHFVLIEHPWGESLYAHLSAVHVRPHMPVTAGQVIALSGQTGRCYGAHLHFGIRLFPYRRTDGWGGFCDPTPFLDPATLTRPRTAAVQPEWALAEWPEEQCP